MARFFIVLMAHQSAWCIRHAIESLISQSFEDWECLICDDASTDGTQGIVDEYITDPRIAYFRHASNVGQALNWSHGLAHATATYVATLHADDVWFNDTLQTYANAFDQTAYCDFVAGSWLRTDSNLRELVHQPQARPTGEYDSEAAVRFVLIGNSVLPSASAFRRSLVDLAGYPKSDYGMLCDRDYFVRLALASRSMVILNRPVMRYRIHEASVTSEYVRDHRLLDELIGFEMNLQGYLRDHSKRQELMKTYKKHSADFFFRNGMSLFQDGDYQKANQILAHACECDPMLLRNPKRFIKWLVFRCGPLGRRVMSYIHNRNSFVNDLA
jgi:glycosyltransferase involved in cell wall biosynthesis